MPPDSLFLLAFLLLSAVIFWLGVPLFCGLVPPNHQYGIRTPQTLRDPVAWYAANRTCGFWLMTTGIATTAVCAGLYTTGVPLPFVIFFTAAAVVSGVIIMAVQSDAAARRRAVAKWHWQFRLLSLFTLTAVAAIACAIARLPDPWIFKVAILFAYLICVLGLVVANYKSPAPPATTQDRRPDA